MPGRSTVMNAKTAIARHVQWKIELQLAITMQEALSEEQVTQILQYRKCAIGRWLDSPATLPMRARPEYDDLVRKHVEFHQQMKKISELIAAKRYEDAARSVSPCSDFVRSSKTLANAIMAYDGISVMAVPA